MTNFLLKLAVTNAIIILCWEIGKKSPSLAGLIAVMPLTGFMVLMWLYLDRPGDYSMLATYTKGALWGILPSILFFSVAHFCFKKHLSMPWIVVASFSFWFGAAFLHQWWLR